MSSVEQTMNSLVMVLACALDWLFEEPTNAIHPVAWFGRFARRIERLAPRGDPYAELFYGAGITASGIGLVILPALVLERACTRKRTWVSALVIAAALKITFAWRALIRAGEVVQMDLEADQLDAARSDLGALVSRDTTHLDASAVSAATIESLAENASDSFVAPIFYYLLFGLPGAFAYRAANTLDAMVGYHGRYEFLGKIPARLDDVLNWIPARLTALSIVAAARLAGANPLRAREVLRRDHSLTVSPNAGYPMSAMAGALDISLEKVGQYRLNDSGRAARPSDIGRAARLVSLALGIALVSGVLIATVHRRK